MNPDSAMFTSDYPIDQVIFITSGSFTIPNNFSDGMAPGIEIPHGLPFTPLPIPVWSNSPDFSTTYENMDEQAILAQFSTMAGQELLVEAGATSIKIWRTNFSGSSKTVYYRIFCFAPSSAPQSSEVPVTASQAESVTFSSDYNYMKLFRAGELTNATPFVHGLGYVPRVQVWYEVSGDVGRWVSAQEAGSFSSGVIIDEDSIRWANPSVYSKIHFRIYLDR